VQRRRPTHRYYRPQPPHPLVTVLKAVLEGVLVVAVVIGMFLLWVVQHWYEIPGSFKVPPWLGVAVLVLALTLVFIAA
jgi:hypothetical protein